MKSCMILLEKGLESVPVLILLSFLTRKYAKRNERVIGDDYYGKYANFHSLARSLTPSPICKLFLEIPLTSAKAFVAKVYNVGNSRSLIKRTF